MMEPTPLRPDDQVAGGFIAMSLGGENFNVRVLPMALSRQWLPQAKQAVTAMRGTAEGLENFEDVADFIAGQSVAMMDLLIAYDALGDKVLPEREWIDTHATDGECYDAWKRVTAATAPLAQEALRIVPDLIPVLIEAFKTAVSKGTVATLVAMSRSNSTSSSLPSMDAGPPWTLRADSPTNSSTSTPRRQRSGARRKSSQH